MNRYFALWKRGWWAWLHMLCANIALGIVSIPFILIQGKPTEPDDIWSVIVVIWLLVGAPVWGWVFEYFASKSERLQDD